MTFARDWRWLVCAAICIYFTALAVLSSRIGEEKAWATFGVVHLEPRFADMYGVLTWLDVKKEGGDPFRENHLDLHGRKMNYPRVWLALGSFGISSRHAVVLGAIVDAAFFAALFGMMGRINPAEAIVYSILISTPAVMLGVERGNFDLLMFSLCVLAARCLRGGTGLRTFGYALILCGGILKFFPIAGLTAVLRERRRHLFLIAGVVGIIFTAYLAATYADLRQIMANTPQQWLFSYGRSIFALKLAANGAAVNVSVVSGLVLAGVTLFACLAAWRTSPPEPATDLDAGYLMGAGIYASTFALGTSFNYRLVFLLLLVPQLLTWTRRRNRFALVQLSAVFVALLVSPFHEHWLFAFRELACWFLFGASVFALIQRLRIAITR